ncbi:hypothetical protein [Streptomyces sp. MUM 178J]|uniref:hypothetical protein n=1 Tax=Streptomyces sp. MUM 178J TaxID=2791991 RepID=UPI001F04B720|nr:hypothetical protein [Streptomyces sp. MUM 178J]WRQ78786.1 hypothetical protein I3F59_004995 [Streptomyces sp. MUM 178J]
MTSADAWRTGALRRVRQVLGLGRLLPLGGPSDGTWIAERAADAVLRREAAAAAPDARLTWLRLGLAAPGEATGAPGERDSVAPGAAGKAGPGDEGEAGRPAAVEGPVPPGALPREGLCIEAEFAAWPRQPLPDLAEALRRALLAAAEERLGLHVVRADLAVTELLDEAPASAEDAGHPAGGESLRHPVARTEEDPVARAAAGTAGVAFLASELGPAVHIAAGHARVEVAAARDARALDVARAVRAAASGALGDDRPVTVLISSVL